METTKSVRMAQSIVGTSKGRPDNDFYPTPAIAVEKLLKVETFDSWIWECACGNGAITNILQSKDYLTISTDLYDHGFGTIGVDFLSAKTPAGTHSIVTNPPFNLVYEFIEHAYELQIPKIAFLCKLALLEGQKRSALLEKTHLSRVWVFRKRLTLTRNGEPQRSSGMIAFAWFVWDVTYHRPYPSIGWI